MCSLRDPFASLYLAAKGKTRTATQRHLVVIFLEHCSARQFRPRKMAEAADGEEYRYQRCASCPSRFNARAWRSDDISSRITRASVPPAGRIKCNSFYACNCAIFEAPVSSELGRALLISRVQWNTG